MGGTVRGLPNPFRTKRFHAILAAVWALSIAPTLLWWKESVLWVALLSVWANFASHLAALAAEDSNQESTE